MSDSGDRLRKAPWRGALIDADKAVTVKQVDALAAAAHIDEMKGEIERLRAEVRACCGEPEALDPYLSEGWALDYDESGEGLGAIWCHTSGARVTVEPATPAYWVADFYEDETDYGNCDGPLAAMAAAADAALSAIHAEKQLGEKSDTQRI